MTTNKRRMILDDHRRLGAELKAMRDRLVEITVQLGSAYAVSDRIVVVAERSWREIDELRAALDNDVFTNYPTMSGSVLKKIYYPGDERG
jgi:hypothetical protein